LSRHSGSQHVADLLKKEVHEFFRLALVEPNAFEEHLCQLGLGECGSFGAGMGRCHRYLK